MTQHGGKVKKMMDKHGGTGVLVFLFVFAIVVFAGIGIYAVRTQQTGLEPGAQAQIIKTQIEAQNAASLLTLIAKDQTSNTLARIDIPAYCYKFDDPTQMLKGAQGDKLSITTATQVTGVGVGDEGICVGFNNSGYYGDPLKWKAESEAGESLTLKVYNTNEFGVGWKFYEDGTKETTQSIDVRADATKNYDKLVIENNISDTQFRLRVIGVDLDANTNISNIELKGSSDSVVKRLRSTLDYVFDVGESTSSVNILSGAIENMITPIVLNEYDMWTSGQLIFTGDAEGCGSQEETMTFYAIDQNYYESVKNGSPATGVEDDQSSPADVGASDYTSNVICS